MNPRAPRIVSPRPVLGPLACTLFGALVMAAGCGGGASGGGTGGGSPGSGGRATGGAMGSGGATSGSGGAPTSTGGAGVSTGGAGVNSGGAPGTGGRGSGGSVSGGAGGAASASGGAGGTTMASGGAGGRAGATGTAGRSGGGGSGAGGSGMTSMGCGAADPNAVKSGRASITVAGTMREYILRLPDTYDANKPHKLIFAFHARGGNASQVSGSNNNDYYGLFARAGSSAIFVSPEGIDAGWRNTGGRDIDFVKAMLAFFNTKLCIDQSRIFSVGFSFGGMMSDAIGCAMADVFRAIAPMAGGLPNAEHPYSECNQPNMHPIAVWMAHGDSDTTVPIADGKAALDLFLKRAQCQAQTTPVTPSPCVAYQGCLPDYPIHFCQWQGGHGVPSFASQAIWTFFNQF